MKINCHLEIVKLHVQFVSVCLKVKKCTQTVTKDTFHPPENFFLCQKKGMDWIGLDAGAMVLILPQLKDSTHFVCYDCI